MKKLSKKEIHKTLINYIYKNKTNKLHQCGLCNKFDKRAYNNFFICCECEIKQVQNLTLDQQKEWEKEHTK